MSTIPVTSSFDSDTMASMVSLYGAMNKVPGFPTAVIWKSFTEWYQAMVSQRLAGDALVTYQSPAVITATASKASAEASYTAAINPAVPSTIGFSIASTTPSSIAHGSSGPITVTVTFLSGYAGTITWSLPANITPVGITATFSPTTNNSSGGTSTGTIAIDSGLAPGNYNVFIQGTDAIGISAVVLIVVNVT